ncbi:unnamed protein product [Effrenium voratum]|nr:unnamed protein product [Effrenium voratum]
MECMETPLVAATQEDTTEDALFETQPEAQGRINQAEGNNAKPTEPLGEALGPEDMELIRCWVISDSEEEPVVSEVTAPAPTDDLQPQLLVATPMDGLQAEVLVATPMDGLQPEVLVVTPGLQPEVLVATPMDGLDGLQPEVLVATIMADLQPELLVATPMADLQPGVLVATPADGPPEVLVATPTDGPPEVVVATPTDGPPEVLVATPTDGPPEVLVAAPTDGPQPGKPGRTACSKTEKELQTSDDDVATAGEIEEMGGDKSEDDEAIEAVAKAKAKRGKAKAAAGPKKTARASRKEAPREGRRTKEKAKRKPKKGGGATEAGKTKLRRMSEHISDGNAGKGSAHSVEDATPKETKEGKVVASAGGAKPEGKVVDSAGGVEPEGKVVDSAGGAKPEGQAVGKSRKSKAKGPAAKAAAAPTMVGNAEDLIREGFKKPPSCVSYNNVYSNTYRHATSQGKSNEQVKMEAKEAAAVFRLHGLVGPYLLSCFKDAPRQRKKRGSVSQAAAPVEDAAGAAGNASGATGTSASVNP